MKKSNQPIDKRESRTRESKIELRNVQPDSESRTISGYAALYNSPTDMGWFEEVILPGAFDGMIEVSDVRALLNHDANHLLARSNKGNGTLSLSVDNKGLFFSFSPPEHRTDVIEMIEREDLSQCSFRFLIDEQRWIERDGEQERREIVKFKELFDITLATFPAYEDTTIALRSRDEAKEDTVDYEAQEKERERLLKIEGVII